MRQLEIMELNLQSKHVVYILAITTQKYSGENNFTSSISKNDKNPVARFLLCLITKINSGWLRDLNVKIINKNTQNNKSVKRNTGEYFHDH